MYLGHMFLICCIRFPAQSLIFFWTCRNYRRSYIRAGFQLLFWICVRFFQYPSQKPQHHQLQKLWKEKVFFFRFAFGWGGISFLHWSPGTRWNHRALTKFTWSKTWHCSLSSVVKWYIFGSCACLGPVGLVLILGALQVSIWFQNEAGRSAGPGASFLAPILSVDSISLPISLSTVRRSV